MYDIFLRTNNGVLALAVSVVLFSCVAMVTLHNRGPMPTELLAGAKDDALAKYVKGAEMELQGLEVKMSTIFYVLGFLRSYALLLCVPFNRCFVRFSSVRFLGCHAGWFRCSIFSQGGEGA
jgi:hypothetical protein